MLLLATTIACFAGVLAAPAVDLSVCVCVTEANVQYRNSDWSLLGFLNSGECFMLTGEIQEKAGTWMELQNVRNEETAWVSGSFLRQDPASCTNVTAALSRPLRSGFASDL